MHITNPIRRIGGSLRRRPGVWATAAAGVGTTALLAALVVPSLGAWTATVSEGVSQTAGTLAMDVSAASFTGDCDATASNSWSATCTPTIVSSDEAPGYVMASATADWSVADTGTLLPGSLDPDFAFTLTPGACSGSNSTICADTWVTINSQTYSPSTATYSPTGCVYGPPPASGSSGCGAPSSSYTLATLADAGILTLPDANVNFSMWYGAPAFQVTVELSPSAPTSDQGATVTLPLSFTMSA